ncbi:MAG: alpha/beta hydrolase-fold protein [Eubacteriales bacterium]|nr:alpha/beta hydrolase-fold protein [Eubacteriales bacterium]
MARLQFYVGQPLVSVDAIIPEYDERNPQGGLTRAQYEANRSLPVLFLLHGAFGNSADWLRHTRIEMFAQEHNMAVVCPSAQNSFYTDWPGSIAWEKEIMENLWAFAQRYLPISDKREDCYVAGLSMGGYGALKFALDYPERFCAVGSFSGALNVPNRYAQTGDDSFLPLGHIFPDRENLSGSPQDLYAWSQTLARSGKPLPKVYLSCGTRDGLYDANTQMRAVLETAGYDVTWDEGDFEHEWRFWDEQVEKFLKWTGR